MCSIKILKTGTPKGYFYIKCLPHFFCHKTGFFPAEMDPKNFTHLTATTEDMVVFGKVSDGSWSWVSLMVDTFVKEELL